MIKSLIMLIAWFLLLFLSYKFVKLNIAHIEKNSSVSEDLDK